MDYRYLLLQLHFLANNTRALFTAAAIYIENHPIVLVIFIIVLSILAYLFSLVCIKKVDDDEDREMLINEEDIEAHWLNPENEKRIKIKYPKKYARKVPIDVYTIQNQAVETL